MATPWTAHIPASIPINWLKKVSADQMGGPPPICIVPIQYAKPKVNPLTMQIKITDTLEN